MKKQGRYLINEVMVVENGNILEVVKGSEKEIVLNDTLQEHIMCALMNIDMEELKEIDWLVKVRSEEHTSELQSPALISYAVFCL